MDGCAGDSKHNGAMSVADSCANWRQSEEKQSMDFDDEERCDLEFCCTLPASCNWYSPNVISCYNGYCAYAGKSSVFVMKLNRHVPRFDWDMIATPKHNLKVTALAIISQNLDTEIQSFPDYIAVGVEDGMLRILNTSSKTVLKEHRSHRVKITAMSWSPATDRILLTGDAKGYMSIWDYEDNSVQLWCPVHSQVLCLQMSPIKKSLFVVGYENGNIVVGDSSQLSVLTTFKSHNDDITSLSWCPVLRDGKDCFASASKDRTVRLWDTMADKSLTVLTSPKSNFSSRGKKDGMKSGYHQVVLWLSNSHIISTAQNGDLVCWDDSRNNTTIGGGHARIIFTMCCDPATKQFVSVSMDRQVIVWNGSSLPRPTCKIPSFGGFVYSLSTSLNNPYTVAMGVGDNTIRVSSTNDSTPGYDFTTLWDGIKSKVTVLALHPTYEGMIGFGTDDGHVGCSSVNTRKTEISLTYHRKCVYSLTWGPQHSYAIDLKAEGCAEVKVNCMYTVGGEGTLLMHKLGALNTDAQDVGKSIKTRNNLTSLPSRSDIAWSVDYTLFSLGNSDGTIDVFETRSLSLVCTVSAHKKMVNTMAWHHNYSYNDESMCYPNWLASGSNEDAVCVSDLSDVIRSFHRRTSLAEDEVGTQVGTQSIVQAEVQQEIQLNDQLGDVSVKEVGASSDDQVTTVTDQTPQSDDPDSLLEVQQTRIQPHVLRPTKQLFGHSSRITRIVWNPHKNGILASASFDGHIRIWDVESAMTLATFTGHSGRVYTVAWSYLDNDVVYSGGEDFTSRRWNISVLSNDSATASKRKKKTKKKKSDYAKDVSNVHSGENGLENYDKIPNKECDEKQKLDIKVVPLTSTESENTEQHDEKPPPSLPNISVNRIPKQPRPDQRPKRKVRSLLKKASAGEGRLKEALQKDCVDLARYLHAHSEDESTCKDKTGIDPTCEDYAHLAPYTTREDAYSLLSNEIQGHEASQTLEPKFYLEMWRNNIGGALDKAVETSSLTDSLVALAPLGGYEMWRAAVLVYAKQLEQQQKIHMSVSYYLAAGEVHKAIYVLRDNGYIKQALVLAKVQLGSDHPLVSEISLFRANKLLKECQFEHAAQSFLAGGDIDAAIITTAKRGDSSSLLTSLEIADIYSMEKHISYLLPQSLAALYKEYRWSELHRLIQRCSTVELIHFQAIVGEYLVEHLYHTDFVQNLYFAVENHKRHRHLTSEEQLQEQLQEVRQQPPFLVSILQSLEHHCNFSKHSCEQLNKLIDFHGAVKPRVSTTTVSVQDLWSDTVNSVLSGIVYLINSNCASAFKQWLMLFDILQCAGYPYTVLALYQLLFPHHHVSFGETLALSDTNDGLLSRVSQTAFSNFTAFRCSSILFYIWYEISNSSSTEPNEKPCDTIDLSIESICNSVDKISIDKISFDSTLSSYNDYCCQDTLYFTLTWLSSILLSSVHSTYSALQSEYNSIEEQLLECDIKKRLSEHILARKQGDCKPNKANEESDDKTTLRELCNDMVDVVAEVETNGLARAHKGVLQGQRKNEMLTSYLKCRKDILSGKLAHYPPEVAEFAFPDTLVSYVILLVLCSAFKRTDERLFTLLRDIRAWGALHELKLPQYVKHLAEKN